MSRVRITDRTLSKQHDIPADQKRIELWDNVLPGFGVRVTGRGVKSYFVVTRLGRQKIRVTLGKYPALPLADARDKAR